MSEDRTADVDMNEQNPTKAKPVVLEAIPADQLEIQKILRELNKAKDTLVQSSVQLVSLRRQTDQEAQRVVDLDNAMHTKIKDAALNIGINPKLGSWSFDYSTMKFTSTD